MISNNSLELSEQNSPKSINKSIMNSPVIVLSNSDYKRPSSIISSRSNGSNESKSKEDYLPIYWWGCIMLSCHFFIGILLVLGSLFDFIWNSVDLFNPILRPLKEIPTWMSFLLSLEILASMLISIKTPMMVLLGGSNRFRKYYRYKDHKVFLYATFGIIIGAIICFGIHLSVYFSKKSTKLTPYLASAAFLLLHGILNIRLYWELDDGGDSGNAMMLPFITGEDYDEGTEEMSEISAV